MTKMPLNEDAVLKRTMLHAIVTDEHQAKKADWGPERNRIEER